MVQLHHTDTARLPESNSCEEDERDQWGSAWFWLDMSGRTALACCRLTKNKHNIDVQMDVKSTFPCAGVHARTYVTCTREL